MPSELMKLEAVVAVSVVMGFCSYDERGLRQSERRASLLRYRTGSPGGEPKRIQRALSERLQVVVSFAKSPPLCGVSEGPDGLATGFLARWRGAVAASSVRSFYQTFPGS